MTHSSPLAAAVARAAARDLSVVDLIRTAEQLRLPDGLAGVLALYDAWVRHNEDHPLLHAVLFNQSVALTEQGDLAAAQAALERCLALVPDFGPAHINLGRLRERQGDAGAAVRQWSALVDGLSAVTGMAVAHKVAALNQMARVLEENSQDQPAEAMLRQSLELDRDQPEALQHLLALRQRQLEWPVVAPWERVSRETLLRGMSPLSMAAWCDDPMLQLAAAWNYNRRDVGTPRDGMVTRHWAAREAAADGMPGRLRIGYLSSDFRDHAVGYLMVEALELHDKQAVEIFAYYCGQQVGGALQERVRAAVDHWVPLAGLDDAAAARRIADDGIHILVDCNGYTRDGRTKLVARRPAPVIVNWLGYPGTMASPYHHYLVADEWIVPPESEIYYSERVLRLPCYQPTDRKRPVSPLALSRADVGLPEDAMVFCCFNGLQKLTPATLQQWLTILERVPDSVLWLLAGAPQAEQTLRAAAAARAIAPDRLVFAERRLNADHLARYPLADLFLDTLPYGAHTTASDALWMGVPVLTLSGRSFAARVCGSLVRSAGLPDLVCASAEEYVDRAVALGRDRTALQRYRVHLAAHREDCTLFDIPGLVRCLEALYAQMWSEFQAGQLPVPDLGTLESYFEIGMAQDEALTGATSETDAAARWRQALADHHRYRPIPPDRRLWRGASG